MRVKESKRGSRGKGSGTGNGQVFPKQVMGSHGGLQWRSRQSTTKPKIAKKTPIPITLPHKKIASLIYYSLIINVSCRSSPRKIPPIMIPPNTSLPKSSSNFPTSSLNVVLFLAFFIGDFFIFFIPHILPQTAFLP